MEEKLETLRPRYPKEFPSKHTDETQSFNFEKLLQINLAIELNNVIVDTTKS